MTAQTTEIRHTARVEWDGHYWIAVPDCGGLTQAKRLSQLPERLAEVIQLMTNVKVDANAISLDIHVDDDLSRETEGLRKERQRLEMIDSELAARTLATARALRDRGMNLRDIGTLTGLSYQRVHQMLGGS